MAYGFGPCKRGLSATRCDQCRQSGGPAAGRKLAPCACASCASALAVQPAARVARELPPAVPPLPIAPEAALLALQRLSQRAEVLGDEQPIDSLLQHGLHVRKCAQMLGDWPHELAATTTARTHARKHSIRTGGPMSNMTDLSAQVSVAHVGCVYCYPHVPAELRLPGLLSDPAFVSRGLYASATTCQPILLTRAHMPQANMVA